MSRDYKTDILLTLATNIDDALIKIGTRVSTNMLTLF
jgi:hypothetical protein